MAPPRTRRIGILAFDGVQALDLFGPLDAFHEASTLLARAPPPYQAIVVSATGRAVVTASGVSIAAHCGMDACPPLDTLIIPGGIGSRPRLIPGEVVAWIRMQSERGVRLGSVCTGLFILARTGLLDGKRATTHWAHVDETRAAFPALRLDPDALFVREGKLFTAAGVTAGIDVALALIEEDHGARLASAVARYLVMYLKRSGDQKQYSSLLAQQAQAPNRFAELVAWIADNLAGDLSSLTLAERANLSERQFRRRFQGAFGETPTRFIERMRIERAREWLIDSRLPIDRIARMSGFREADTFRRAFERRHGVAPGEYRNRFARAFT